jgi:hypothetical protein
MIKNGMKIQNMNNVMSGGVPMSFPLAGNFSETTPSIPLLLRGNKERFRTLQKDGGQASRNDRQWISGIHNLQSPIRNEKGIALVMILILAAIALAIMAGLIYMLTSSTQISGMQKRYNTAREASVGGANIAYQFIATRGDSTDTQSFLNIIKNLCPDGNAANCIKTPNACTGTEEKTGHSFTGLEAKLRTPSTSWSAACYAENMSIIPSNATTYDMTFDVGESPYPTYRVYAKIVHTMEGNSGSDSGLLGSGVVASGSGEVAVVSRPFLYTMEVDSENAANPLERAKLSILYEY